MDHTRGPLMFNYYLPQNAVKFYTVSQSLDLINGLLEIAVGVLEQLLEVVGWL